MAVEPLFMVVGPKAREGESLNDGRILILLYIKIAIMVDFLSIILDKKKCLPIFEEN
jgi:hypothetical protein